LINYCFINTLLTVKKPRKISTGGINPLIAENEKKKYFKFPTADMKTYENLSSFL